MENDMITDLIEFPEFDAFNASKTCKRRSSILKTFDANVQETNREERKSTRRVSWAQTYQYKELHADGTTFIFSQQLAKSSEENIEHTEPKSDECGVDVTDNTSLLNKSLAERKQMKINANDFVKKLRNVGNCSNSVSESKTESPNRKSKRIANRSMIRTIDENNENSLQKLVETEMSGDLMQSRDNVDMELTSLNSSPSIDQNVSNCDAMSVKMSIEEESVDNVSDTKVFTDNDMEITLNSSQDSELIKFNSIDGEKNCSNSKQLNRMLNTTMISNYSLLDLSNTNSIISVNNEQSLIQSSVQENNVEEAKNDFINIPNEELQSNGCLVEANNNSNLEIDSKTRKNNKRVIQCNIDSPLEKKMKIDNYLEDKNKSIRNLESADNVCEQNENSLVGSVVDMELTPINTSISTDSKLINSSDCLPNKTSIDQQTNEPINTTKVFADNDMEMTLNSESQESELIKFNTTEMEMTLTSESQESELIKFNTTEENSIDKNQFEMHNTAMISNINLIDSNSMIDTSKNYHSILNDDISKTELINPVDDAINEISVENFRRSDKESFGITNLQCDNELYVSNNSIAYSNRNSFLTDPFTARFEMVKSNIKDSLGLSLKHKLKQKRQELEAKRKQTEQLVSSSVNIIVENKDSVDISEREVFNTTSSPNINDSESTVSDTSEESSTNKDHQELSTNKELSNAQQSEEKSISSNNDTSSTSKDSTMINETINDTTDANSVYTLFSLSDSNSNDVEPNSPSILMKSITNIITNTSIERLSDSFDPFIHTDHSFQANSTFYKSLSPLQLSFMVREDTLCLLADELDGKVKDILLPMEKSLIERETMSNEKLDKSVFNSDYAALAMKYEQRTDQRTVISFLWGSFVLDIKFGEFIDSSDSREIVYINMKSLIDAENALNLRQQNLVWQFRDEHKPLLSVAHQLIISSYESKKDHILNKYKTSSQLNELLSDELMDIIFRAKSLLTELRILSSFVICHLLPKDNDTFNFVVELLGLRKTIYLILPINPEVYPFAVIKPKFIIRSEERDIYCLTNFTAALLRINPGFNYIQRLIKAAKFFIKAMKKIIIDQQKNMRQKREIEYAKLPFN